MTKGANRSGSDAARRARALEEKEAKRAAQDAKRAEEAARRSKADRGGRNLGAKGNNPKAPGRREEHSRIDKRLSRSPKR